MVYGYAYPYFCLMHIRGLKFQVQIDHTNIKKMSTNLMYIVLSILFPSITIHVKAKKKKKCVKPLNGVTKQAQQQQLHKHLLFGSNQNSSIGSNK